ncbi:hypothetical protein BpHYR1_014937 [Brachionus plicatilis]|uniref:Uncharacterized protein n=1 Tax=Brachionus plicatilis TaxID=10195 RepID=A0A3M7SBR9_BRAPC|nr:hypothetical protein BpHYR1_014937 [Brachionus plicatilis]
MEIALEQGEQTEEAEPSLTIETETEFISKEKAIAGLNTAREYLMNSKEDCRNEINSVFKLLASIQSIESKKQLKITSFFSLSN